MKVTTDREGRPRVLLVDDDELFLRSLSRGLEPHRARWVIDAAEGGEAGVSAIRGKHHDVLVTDLVMPIARATSGH